MTSSTQLETVDIRVRDVALTDDTLSVGLMDGRTITVPLAWYPRLANASPEQRAHWEAAGAGNGIHWPDIDEDLSTADLLRGAPAPRGSERLRSYRTLCGAQCDVAGDLSAVASAMTFTRDTKLV